MKEILIAILISLGFNIQTGLVPDTSYHPATVSNVVIDTENEIWEKITITSDNKIEMNTVTNNMELVVEMDANSVGQLNINPIKRSDNSEKINDVVLYTMNQSDTKSSIESMLTAVINDKTYLYIKTLPDREKRIYLDPLDNRILHIDIAKVENPYSYLVVLDPGHGGHDPGATRNGVHEKDINLDIALKMEHLLKDNGIDVVYTRTTDKFIPLKERSNISNKVKPDAFISIHVNASRQRVDKGSSGFSTHTIKRYNAEERIKLANSIQEELVSSLGWKDNGIKFDNLSVVRETHAVAVLVENGFISNPKEIALLSKNSIRYDIAKAITRGVTKYLLKANQEMD